MHVTIKKPPIATHKFYETKDAPDGIPYNIHKSNKIMHPIAMSDRGNRYIDVITDSSNLSDKDLARLIAKAKMHSYKKLDEAFHS